MRNENKLLKLHRATSSRSLIYKFASLNFYTFTSFLLLLIFFITFTFFVLI